MKSIVSILNDVLFDWKKQHDILSGVASQFNECEDFLCFDDFPLCKLTEDLSLESMEFDSDSIQYFLSANRCISITFTWPEDAPPVVSSVSLSYNFSSAEALYIETAAKSLE